MFGQLTHSLTAALDQLRVVASSTTGGRYDPHLGVVLGNKLPRTTPRQFITFQPLLIGGAGKYVSK